MVEVTSILSLDDERGHTYPWWTNFLRHVPVEVGLDEALELSGVLLPELDDRTVYHLEFVSQQARLMFLLRWS